VEQKMFQRDSKGLSGFGGVGAFEFVKQGGF